MSSPSKITCSSMSLLETLIQEREHILIALHERLTGESVTISNNHDDIVNRDELNTQIEPQNGRSKDKIPEIRQESQGMSMENDAASDLKAKVKDDLTELKRRTDISIRNILRLRIITETSDD